jgi:anti-sigma factor RsiW
MSTTSHHIPLERLADLAEGRLLPFESDAARAHISSCSSCAGRLARLEQVVGLMRTDTAEDAPPDVLARAVGLFRPRSASAERPSNLKRILATLSFDSMQAAHAFGVRSGQTSGRQLLFRAGENDLDLRVAPSGDAWVVSGQVLGECSGGRVELRGASGAVAQVVLNDLCEFSLPPVRAGDYTLRLRLPDVEIEVPEIDLRG